MKPQIKPQTELIRFEFKDTLKTDAYKETFLLDENARRIKPIHEEYSKTKAHGVHYYTKEQVNRTIAILTIDISNSGKHYCSVEIKKEKFEKLTPQQRAKILKRILDIHYCPRVLQDLSDYL